MSIRHIHLASLLLSAAAACHEPNLEVAEDVDLDTRALSTATAPPSQFHGVMPDLRQALERGDTGELDIEVRIAVPPLEAPTLKPSVATIEVAGDRPVYTLDGQSVDDATMTARATAERRALDEHLVRQFETRRRLVAAAIADAGVRDAVHARGDTWFRARLPADRAQGLLRALDGRITWARLASDDAQAVHIVNDLHDNNGNNNPLDDGDDGALESMGVIDFAHAYGMRGQGVGIWHNEGFAPYWKRPEFAEADLRYLTSAHWQPVLNGGECRYNDECCSGSCTGDFIKTCNGSGCPNCMDDGMCVSDIRSQEHSTLVALIAHLTAPDATIYHTATTLADCMLSSSIDPQASPPVYVGAQSWHFTGGGETNNDYNHLGMCNGEFDDYIRASRIAHFHSSGNANADYVMSPGRAYNGIAVGNYDHIADSISLESGYKNPSTGVEKPEIIAPGTGITAAPGWTRSGTSIASPMAAGFVADMMSGSAFFLNQPQAIKAYLIAGAHNVLGGSGFGALSSTRDGAGRMDYLDSYFYRWGKTWNGGNDDHFNAQEKIVETRTLTAGKHYTIAIAWLASGNWAAYSTADAPGYAGPPLNMQMKLTVSRGAVVKTSAITSNNFQLVDLTVPADGGGNWTITIERTYNAGIGGLDLALTVGEHG